MQTLLPQAERIAKLLIARNEKIGVVESSTGGLLAATLLAVPGASAYFLGGAVVYTQASRTGLLGITDADMKGIRGASEPYAELKARKIREKLGAAWALAESGAAGPAGNRYGDSAGHSAIAVLGPGTIRRVLTIETGSDDRQANMRAFAKAALDALEQALKAA